ncbi:MAG TPA: hypothetical protein VGF26_17280, partial [Ramlibacter sp.]
HRRALGGRLARACAREDTQASEKDEEVAKRWRHRSRYQAKTAAYRARQFDGAPLMSQAGHEKGARGRLWIITA